MPVKIPNELPVKDILEKENIFVMDETRAMHQDIRPLEIVLLNLMPLKGADRAPDSAGVVQHAPADRCHVHEDVHT